MLFWLEHFFIYIYIYLRNFNITENINIVGIAFDRNVTIYKISSFKDFQNVVFVSKSF